MESFKYFWEDFTENKEIFLGSYMVSEEEILNFAKEAINYFEHGEIFRKNKSLEAKLASLRIFSGVPQNLTN